MILEIEAVHLVEIHQGAQPQGSLECVHIIGIHLQVLDQDAPDMGRNGFIHCNPYDGAIGGPGSTFYVREAGVWVVK